MKMKVKAVERERGESQWGLGSERRRRAEDLREETKKKLWTAGIGSSHFGFPPVEFCHVEIKPGQNDALTRAASRK